MYGFVLEWITREGQRDWFDSSRKVRSNSANRNDEIIKFMKEGEGIELVCSFPMTIADFPDEPSVRM